jgi:hypothetical protein
MWAPNMHAWLIFDWASPAEETTWSQWHRSMFPPVTMTTQGRLRSNHPDELIAEYSSMPQAASRKSSTPAVWTTCAQRPAASDGYHRHRRFRDKVEYRDVAALRRPGVSEQPVSGRTGQRKAPQPGYCETGSNEEARCSPLSRRQWRWSLLRPDGGRHRSEERLRSHRHISLG